MGTVPIKKVLKERSTLPCCRRFPSSLGMASEKLFSERSRSSKRLRFPISVGRVARIFFSHSCMLVADVWRELRLKWRAEIKTCRSSLQVGVPSPCAARYTTILPDEIGRTLQHCWAESSVRALTSSQYPWGLRQWNKTILSGGNGNNYFS
eukprot:scaffold6966_cov112-Cylindrotheca_fusiformis.AAC.16